VLGSSATAEELYLAANPSDVGEVTLVGVSDGTEYSIVDLERSTDVETGALGRFQVVVSDVSGLAHLLVRSSHPLLVYLGHDCCGVGGSTFVPTEAGHSAVGREFVLFIPVYGTQSDLYVFAVEDARVVLTDPDGGLVAERTVASGDAWLAYPVVGARPYVVRSTGDIAIMLSAVNGLATVPPARRELSCDGDVGREFLLATHSWGTGAIAVFAYDRSRITIAPIGSESPIDESEVEAGSWLFVTEVWRRAYRIASTGDVAVWAGDLEGGSAIGDMGDDFSFDLGRGGRDVIVHSQNHGATVLAPYDGTSLTVDGREYQLDSGQWVDLEPRRTSRIVADRPVVAMTFGGNDLNDWGGFLRPAPPLSLSTDPCPDVDADVPDFPDGDVDADVDAPVDADRTDSLDAEAALDADEPELAVDADVHHADRPRSTCDCRASGMERSGAAAVLDVLVGLF
jgi:hypothetical protein